MNDPEKVWAIATQNVAFCQDEKKIPKLSSGETNFVFRQHIPITKKMELTISVGDDTQLTNTKLTIKFITLRGDLIPVSKGFNDTIPATGGPWSKTFRIGDFKELFNINVREILMMVDFVGDFGYFKLQNRLLLPGTFFKTCTPHYAVNTTADNTAHTTLPSDAVILVSIFAAMATVLTSGLK